MKFNLRIIITLILLCLVLGGMFVFAEPIDIHADASLTLVYRHNGVPYSALTVDTYRVADVYEDGTYALTDTFSAYPVNIYGITSKGEWDEVCSTLVAYIAADGILSDHTAITDSEGKVIYDRITPGMYLTRSVRCEGEEQTVVFESFLTVVPIPDDNGNIYDVTAIPKASTFTPDDGEVTYTVVKHWRDNGATGLRPESIQVDIIKDGVHHSTEILNKENNWSYSWTCPDDGATWQAVERGVHGKYTVTSLSNADTIVITNTLDYDDPTAPPMGTTTVIWPYILLLCFSGGIFLLISIRLMRTR